MIDRFVRWCYRAFYHPAFDLLMVIVAAVGIVVTHGWGQWVWAAVFVLWFLDFLRDARKRYGPADARKIEETD